MPHPAIAEMFLTSCQWPEGCLGDRKLALLPLALLQHFLAACEPLYMSAMPCPASLPAIWTRSQAAAPCGLTAGARSYPDLLSVPWGHSCPCSSHPSSDTAPPEAPALLALSTWLIPLQPRGSSLTIQPQEQGMLHSGCCSHKNPHTCRKLLFLSSVRVIFPDQDRLTV